MGNTSARFSHEFGPFRYDGAQRVLFRDERPVSLEPKVLDTLEALLERRGEVIEKAELMRRVWPDCVVEEIGLSRNISILRKAIEDDQFAFIETVPKRGYRFRGNAAPANAAAQPEVSAPTRPEPEAAPPPSAESPLPSRAGGERRTRSRIWPWALALLVLGAFTYWQFYRPSRFLPEAGQAAVVAVIPVECLTAGMNQEAYSAGLAAALVAELSRLPGVQLISPGTVGRYHQLGVPVPLMTRLLGVHVVMEGTAQVQGDRLQVSLRLSDVRSGRLIWAQNFEGPASDRLARQGGIAREAAAQVAPFLRPNR